MAQPNSYRIAPYLKAAAEMGLDVLVASQGEYSLVTEINAGLHIDLSHLEQALSVILNEAQHEPFVGVLGCDDGTVELAAKVGFELGLPHNPAAAARLSQRKDLARAHLAKAGCSVPTHWLIDLQQPLAPQMTEIVWPCVIKPLNLSASRGVIRTNSQEEFYQACGRIQAIIKKIDVSNEFEKTHVLVESYIDGIEVAYEGYLDQGELVTLTLFDKPDPLEGPYFEETIYVTPSGLDEQTQITIKKCIETATQAYGLTTGPIHAECRIDSCGVCWILEVACRTIGGDCGRILDGDHFNLEKLNVALAINDPVKVQPPEYARGVMMIPIPKAGILRRTEGLLDASKVPLIEKIDIIIATGNKLTPCPEGNQYLGYIFAQGCSASEVTNALRTAHAKLNFVIAPIFHLIV